MKPTHKVKLSGNHYNYKQGTWVKVYPATNLPYKNAYWILNNKEDYEDPIGKLLRIDNGYYDYTQIRRL